MSDPDRLIIDTSEPDRLEWRLADSSTLAVVPASKARDVIAYLLTGRPGSLARSDCEILGSMTRSQRAAMARSLENGLYHDAVGV